MSTDYLKLFFEKYTVKRCRVERVMMQHLRLWGFPWKLRALGMLALLVGSGIMLWFQQNRSTVLAVTDPAPALRVMTWNSYFLNKDRDAFLAVVAAEKPDLIAIQELNTLIAETASRNLTQEYPFQVLFPARTPAGLGILSRYPLVTTADPDFSPVDGCNCQVVTIDFNGVPVTLINTHPWPPKLGFPFRRASAQIGLNTENQDRIFDQLLQQMAQAAAPLLVVGDLNTMPIQANYRRVNTLLHDAYVESGVGPASTFPVKGNEKNWFSQPLLRIDYIFHDDAWQAQKSWVGTIEGSDHRYVIADLSFLGAQP